MHEEKEKEGLEEIFIIDNDAIKELFKFSGPFENQEEREGHWQARRLFIYSCSQYENLRTLLLSLEIKISTRIARRRRERLRVMVGISLLNQYENNRAPLDANPHANQ